MRARTGTAQQATPGSNTGRRLRGLLRRPVKFAAAACGVAALALSATTPAASAAPGPAPATATAPATAATGVPPAPHGAVTTWAASADNLGGPTQSDLTYRDIVHTSAGGSGLRIRLSNAFGEAPTTFGRAYVGLQQLAGSVVPGTNHPVTFHGSPSVTVPAGATVYSDPLRWNVPAGSDLAVSVYVSAASPTATGHHLTEQTSYYSGAGDHAAEEGGASFGAWTGWWFYLDAVTVDPKGGTTGAVAAFGDSITDGAASTANANRRWPDYLARRLAADPRTRIKGVANEGISGNKVLSDGAGQSALKRMDRDVLTQPGLRSIILLEGVNDIKQVPAPTADQVIAGYRQITARAHAAGKCVIGATVMPYEGWREWTPEGEKTRQAVNAYIRSAGAFDAVADFDRTVADPADPAHILPALDGGDHLHPNDAGYLHMGDGIDLGLFDQ